MEDLEKYEVSWEEPLKFELKNGLTLHTVTPPGSGAIVGGILKLMDSFNISKNTEFQNTYQFIEASKFAFAQRSKLGDWNDPEILDSVKDTIKNIQSNNWTQWVLDRWNENLTVNNTQFYGANFQYVMEDHGTSHVSILAPNGDAVSVTSTVNTYFGSGTMSKSTRIVFNNEMEDFSTPNTTNFYGIPASQENFIKPNKRPTSSMSPSIIVDGKKNVKLVVGASGGPRIITSVSYATMRHLWMNENIKAAIDAPRPHHQLVPMKVFAEIGTPRELVQYLRNKGHIVDVVDVYFAKNYGGARVQAVSVDDNDIITANNDRRKEGEVDGI